MLTVEQLKAMPPGTRFATGVDLWVHANPTPIRWVAVRGKINDWAIYCHNENKSIAYIADYGDKVCSLDAARLLVPCSEDALALYRSN